MGKKFMGKIENFTCTLLLILTSFFSQGDCFSSGAPSWDLICRSMTPGHLYTPRPTGSFPYVIQLDKTRVLGGDNVTVTLRAPDSVPPFKGFLVMARKFSPNANGDGSPPSPLPQGKFVQENKFSQTNVSMEDNQIQLTNCFDLEASAATHVTSKDKRQIVLKWQAPQNIDGPFVIVTTVVSSFSTYWVNQPSQVILVNRIPSTSTSNNSPVQTKKGQLHHVRQHDKEGDNDDSSGMFQKFFKSIFGRL